MRRMTSIGHTSSRGTRARIIGELGTGFKTALATLDHTRPTIGAQALGIAQGALGAGIAYSGQRLDSMGQIHPDTTGYNCLN